LAYGGVEAKFNAFLTSAVEGGENKNCKPLRFTLTQKDADTDWLRGWVGTGTGLKL